MKIELNEIKIADLVNGYLDKAENGVVGFDGKLDIRPAYQREFVYSVEQSKAVIDTVLKGFPLNVMYWVEKDDGTYEILDGQQRTVSVCRYYMNKFSIDGKTYYNQPKDIQKKFDDYRLMIYICSGTDSEKLDWFKTINIAGMTLKPQELRNATYTGAWLTDAKKYFSKTNCSAHGKANAFIKGEVNRQDYLEVALKWICHRDKIEITDYMSAKHNSKDADELWQYFESVIDWVNRIFKTYRINMKGQPWGEYYNQFHKTAFNSKEIEDKVCTLMNDEEITTQKGIYEYVLSGKESCLSLRAFSDKDKNTVFERQMVDKTAKAFCPHCNDKTKLFNLSDMEADHIVPWSKGGKTTLDNCQMLCRHHNGIKSNH